MRKKIGCYQVLDEIENGPESDSELDYLPNRQDIERGNRQRDEDVSSFGDSFLYGVEDAVIRAMVDPCEEPSTPVKKPPTRIKYVGSDFVESTDCNLSDEPSVNYFRGRSGEDTHQPPKPRNQNRVEALPPWIKRVVIASFLLFCVALGLVAFSFLSDHSQKAGTIDDILP